MRARDAGGGKQEVMRSQYPMKYTIIPASLADEKTMRLLESRARAIRSPCVQRASKREMLWRGRRPAEKCGTWQRKRGKQGWLVRTGSERADG